MDPPCRQRPFPYNPTPYAPLSTNFNFLYHSRLHVIGIGLSVPAAWWHVWRIAALLARFPAVIVSAYKRCYYIHIALGQFKQHLTMRIERCIRGIPDARIPSCAVLFSWSATRLKFFNNCLIGWLAGHFAGVIAVEVCKSNLHATQPADVIDAQFANHSCTYTKYQPQLLLALFDWRAIVLCYNT